MTDIAEVMKSKILLITGPPQCVAKIGVKKKHKSGNDRQTWLFYEES